MVADIVFLLFRSRFLHQQVFLEQMYHSFVEAVEVREEIVGVIDETPLASCVLITPSVALTREIDPLGMSELIAHEVEVSAIDGRSRDETDHLMQRYTAVGHIGRMAMFEMPVHVGVHEPEDDGLVPDERLVMALGIGDGLLVLSAVGHLKEDVSGFPVLVLDLLDILDPEIGDTHRQTIVEADTAVLDRRGESGHAGHLFGDGDSVGFDLMDDLVREGEVHECIAIFVAVEIRGIAVEILSQTM